MKKTGSDRKCEEASRPPAFLAWADGRGGAWRHEEALWICERCDFTADAIVCAIGAPDNPGAPWAVRRATAPERATFLRPLPRWIGIVVGRTAKGLPVALQEAQDARFTAVVHGGIDASLFERVEARTVNGEVLADSISGSVLAGELRSYLQRGLPIPQRMRGASSLHCRAFEVARELAGPESGGTLAASIDSALASGGARLVDWRRLSRGEVSILWTPANGALAGQFIESRARADTLGLLNAGICVSGADKAFDIASLALAVTRCPGAPRYRETREPFGLPRSILSAVDVSGSLG